MPQPPPSPNAEQIAAWNDTVGPTWIRFGDELDRQLEPHGRAALERAGFACGQRVLDVGCGAGATTLEIAARVGSRGSVLAVDVSRTLLERARARAAALGNVAFQAADAQTYAFGAEEFDGVFSRFGVMFFDDPAAAFANLRRAVKPGGRLAFVCWRGVDENIWVSLPMRAAAGLVAAPASAAPGAPGPFAFADPARVKDILDRSGWSGLDIQALDLEMGGGGLETTTALMLRTGPLGAALREAGAPAELMARIGPRIRDTLRPYLTAQGVVLMPSSCWLVIAAA